MTNNQHAARLLEMAEARRKAARQHSDTESALLDSGLTDLAQKYAAMAAIANADAAALLAGAEALEAVEAYRRYDAFGSDNSAWVGPEAMNSAETSKRLWAEFRAALARLEGL
jgi:hypothetical protein